MCLGAPGQIVEIHGDVAVVEFWGARKRVSLERLKEPIVCGDYIIEHHGHADRRIPPADVLETLALYEIVLCEAGEDPIARNIAEELELEPV